MGPACNIDTISITSIVCLWVVNRFTPETNAYINISFSNVGFSSMLMFLELDVLASITCSVILNKLSDYFLPTYVYTGGVYVWMRPDRKMFLANNVPGP